MTAEFQTIYKTRQVVNGIEVFEMPFPTENFAVSLNIDGENFILLSDKLKGEKRDEAIKRCFEQFDKNTLQPISDLVSQEAKKCRIIN